MDPAALRALLDAVPERVQELTIDGQLLRVVFHPPATPVAAQPPAEEFPGLSDLGLRLPRTAE